MNKQFFSTPSEFSEEFLIVCDGIGMRKAITFLIDRKNFNNNLVMITLKGELHVEQNGKQLILKDGEGVIMELRSQHKYYANPNIKTSFIWFHFRGKPCEAVMEKLEKDGQLPFWFKDTGEWKKIYRCLEIISEAKKYEYTVSSIIYDIILNISEKAYSDSENSDEFILNVNSYIEKNIFSDITLDDLAKSLHLSKYYFCRCFKAKLGMPPIQYVILKKIEAAKKILITSNDKIDSISNELCFTDRSHFSKAFKKYTGQSPGEYRKAYLK